MSALDLVVTATWKGSLLVTLVLLLTYALRGRMPARWVHALLVVALMRMVLPFAPSSPVSLFNLAPRREPLVVQSFESATRMARAPLPVRVPAPPPVDSRAPWQNALLAIWAGGVVVATIRIAMQSRAVRRIVANAEPLANSRVLDECREVMHVRRNVAVAISDAVHAPALYGVLRPTLLLPPHDFADEQLRFVFLHELAHLRRFDVLMNWIAAVVHALHWFNPLVRIAVSRLAEERELACDALALESLASSERAAYGGTLLRMLDQRRLPPPVPGLVGMSTTHDQVKRRIRMIATFRAESRRGVWMALVLVVAAISLTDATAGEPQRVMMMKKLSPAGEATMQRLDAHVSIDLTAVSIEQILQAVSNASGVPITIAPEVINDAARETTFDIKAENVPAHVVLVESLNAVDLALEFDDAGGAQIRPIPEDAKLRTRMIEDAAATEVERVIVRKGAEADADAAEKEAERGESRRKVTLRGSEGGQADGTFSIEVHRRAASAQH